MKQNVIIFIIAFAVAFGGAYLFFQAKEPATQVAPQSTETVDKDKGKQEEQLEENEKEKEPQTVSAEMEILDQKGCLGCHSVSKLGLTEVMTGTDLSEAYLNVENKHGKPLDEFLKEPTSAVMSTVIGDNPLTDEEREKVIEALKWISEQ